MGLTLQAAYFVPASHGELSQIEASVHREFEGRISFYDEAKSEWFLGNAKRACEWIELLFEDWWGKPVVSMHMLDQNRVCRAYEEDLYDFYGPIPQLDENGIPL